MAGDFTFLKGNIETIILSSLYNKDKYGYEIAKDIKERTENAYEIKQPTLYSYLKRLQDDDLITSYWGSESNGGRRRYYTLTKSGRESCEKFVSEWNFQRNILSTLVDNSEAATKEVTQADVTPLFGRRTPSKRRSKKEEDFSLSEQDEISRRLSELDGGIPNTTPPEETKKQIEEDASTVESTQVYNEQSTLEQTSTQSNDDNNLSTDNDITDAESAQEVKESTVQDIAKKESLKDEIDNTRRFDIYQDDAEHFMHDFDLLARDASERQGTDQQENYQHVLMGVLGNQLDEAEQISKQQANSSSKLSDRPMQIEEVADKFAQQGIRIRIYNHTTANYKPKNLMPHAKVLCQSAWITYAFAFIYFGILLLCNISSPEKHWVPFLVTMLVIAIIPIALSILAFVDNGRKEKPNFQFRTVFMATLIGAAIVILLDLSICAFVRMEFGKFFEVASKILLPAGIVLLFPIFTWVYNYFYNKY